MEEIKMNADELREALLSSPKNGFVGLSQEERAEMEAYCKRYAAFMDACKTEREATAWATAMAEKHGFVPAVPGMEVKPGDKIYLNNTNQMYALTGNVKEGTHRETFFVNQLRQAYKVHLPIKGDYLIDDLYVFEVGGASKTFKQIKDIPNSYLALDEIEFGTGNTIPLYLFGFLY